MNNFKLTVILLGVILLVGCNQSTIDMYKGELSNEEYF